MQNKDYKPLMGLPFFLTCVCTYLGVYIFCRETVAVTAMLLVYQVKRNQTGKTCSFWHVLFLVCATMWTEFATSGVDLWGTKCWISRPRSLPQTYWAPSGRQTMLPTRCCHLQVVWMLSARCQLLWSQFTLIVIRYPECPHVSGLLCSGLSAPMTSWQESQPSLDENCLLTWVFMWQL